MHDTVPVSDAPSSGAIETHSVNLIDEGDGAELMGDVAHLLKWTHGACVKGSGVSQSADSKQGYFKSVINVFFVRKVVSDPLDHPELTIHGMDRLEGHDLGFAGVSLLQQLSKMVDVVVAEDEFLSVAVPDPLDHGGVVACVGVDLTT